jgi:serine phosphatase RsbU (regulator of sigma subunit)
MPETADKTHLQCLQVWGGTEAVDQTLAMTGLDGYLYARPHRGAARGGDVYYISSCASGRITRAILADVAGHGSQVADIAQDLRALMQRYVNFTSQQRFMRAMNQKFAEITEDGRFATTVALSFFAPTRKLSLSNAGHPAPIWYRAKEKQWIVLGVDPTDGSPDASVDLPFGVESDAGYQQLDIVFKPGDRLLLYTDALIESRDADGNMLGVRGLVDRLNTLGEHAPDQLIPALVERLTEDDRQDLTDDDVTVLLLSANGTRGEWRKTLMSPITVVRGMLKGVPVGAG